MLRQAAGAPDAATTLAEKAKPYPDSPSGMTGVQTLVPIMLDHVAAGRLSLARLWLADPALAAASAALHAAVWSLLLTPLGPVLDGVIQPLLDLLGLKLGEADVQVHGVQCPTQGRTPVLVG